MCREECTVINKRTRNGVLKMMVHDRMALVRQRVAARLEELQAQGSSFQTTSEFHEFFVQVTGWERTIFERDEFMMLQDMMGEDPEVLSNRIAWIIKNNRIELPDGFVVKLESHSWTARDDSGTDRWLVLDLVATPVLA